MDEEKNIQECKIYGNNGSTSTAFLFTQEEKFSLVGLGFPENLEPIFCKTVTPMKGVARSYGGKAKQISRHYHIRLYPDTKTASESLAIQNVVVLLFFIRRELFFLY